MLDIEKTILNKVKNYLDNSKEVSKYYSYKIIVKDFLYKDKIITDEDLNIIYYNENNHYYENKIMNYLIKNK